MAGIIACEALCSQSRRTDVFILLQIIFLGTTIAWTQLLIFPSLLGIDTWEHAAMTAQIINEFRIPIGYGYSNFPLFHIFVALTSIITGFGYKISAMLSVGLGQIICEVLVLYLVGKKIFNNPRAGLLASLLVVIANYAIFMTVWSIPNGYSSVFILFVIFLFLFFKINRKIFTIFLLFIIALILTHTLSAAWAVMFLFILWGGLYVSRYFFPQEERPMFSLVIPIFSSIMMVGWWVYQSINLAMFIKLYETGFNLDAFSAISSIIKDIVYQVPIEEMIFNDIGLYLFFSLSFVGIFYMISKKGNRSTFSLAFVCVAPLIISFSSLMTGHYLLEERWWFIAEMLLSIPLGYGLLLLSSGKFTKNIVSLIFIFCLITTLSFFSILSPPANNDNDIFSPNTNVRYAPIESELASFTFIEKFEGTIKTDNYFASKVLGYSRENVQQFSSHELQQGVFFVQDKELVLVRSYITKKTFLAFNGFYKMKFDLREKMGERKFSNVYNSGSTYAYL
jgi:hypothetical protein